MGFDVNKKVIEDHECEAFAVALLKNGVAEESEIEGSSLIIKEYNAKVTIRVMQILREKENERCFVQIQYSIEHELFDEPVMEGLAGIGKTLRGAVAVSVYNFLSVAFCGFRKCVTGKSMTSLQTTFQGKSHSWQVYDSCASALDGKSDPENKEMEKYWEVWEALKRYLPNYIGAKKSYWINVYCARREDGVAVGEVRINNRSCRELCNLFGEAAMEFPEGVMSSVKRFYYLKQEDATYEAYPHTYEEVESAVLKTLSILKECVTQERYYEYHKKVFEAIEDSDLASELLAFIPEICARGAYNDVGYAEYIGIRRTSAEEMEMVSLSQVTSYYWIEKALLAALKSGAFDKDLYMTCVSLSGTFRAVGELKKTRPDDDLTQEDLCFSIEVSDDYKVR